jgi:hypothetical protein
VSEELSTQPLVVSLRVLRLGDDYRIGTDWWCKMMNPGVRIELPKCQRSIVSRKNNHGAS